MPDIQTVAAPPYLFDHNWVTSAILLAAWNTNIAAALSTDEARRGLMDRPFRTLKREGLTLTRPQAGALLQQARKGTGQRFYMPLSSDVAFVTEETLAGSLTLAVDDTADRRFFVGYKVLVIVWDREKQASSINVLTIDTIAPNELTFTTGTVGVIPAGAVVCPAMECEAALDFSAALITDTHVQFSAEFRERVGPTALPALQAPQTTPTGVGSFLGFPVLDIPHDWSGPQRGERRQATSTSVGLDTVVDIYGTTSAQTGMLDFTQLSRAEAFRLLRFWDSRAGGLFAFWMPGQSADLKLRDVIDATHVSVERSLTKQEILDRRFVSFITSTGRMIVRRITAVDEDIPDAWILVLSADPVFAAGETIDWISFACLAKFATDALDENWSTNQTMTTRLSYIEVRVNSCNTGEVGDNGCDTFTEITEVVTGEDPEDPWEPGDCDPAGVAVPMYYNAADAMNSGREPIRGADLNMPLKIAVTFDPGFEDDPDHEHASPISAECLEALLGQHPLTYMGLMIGEHSDITRNPYQIALQGSDPVWAWGMPSVAPGYTSVEKHWWKKLVNYKIGEEDHVLEIRFVAEHASDGLGTFGGLWGTLFSVYVFSDEINADYLDGDEYEPHNNAKHYVNDPLVWGALYEAANKLAHPRLLIAAQVPTTLHAPNGYSWVPPDEIRFKPCRTKLNGAPWSAGIPINGELNSVFGTAVIAYDMRAMTLGGGRRAEIFPWLCIENGGGQGVTALQPTHAGWDEAVGDLTVADGVDCSVECCLPPQPAFNTCDGHPDEPLEGIGGTHDCWRSSASAEYLCLPINMGSAVRVHLKEACKTITSNYGPFNGVNCPIESQFCGFVFTTTVLTLPFYDYSYSFGGNQLLRIYQFKAFIDNPDYERMDWVFTDLADYTARWIIEVGAGTWARTESPVGHAKAQCTAVETGEVPSAALNYDTPAPLHDFSIEVMSDDTSVEVGGRSRWHIETGQPNGYLYTFNRTTGKLRIYLMLAGVLSIKEEKTVALTGDRLLRFGPDGANHSIAVRVSSSPEVWELLTATDCNFQISDSGYVQGLVVMGDDDDNPVFRDMKVTDKNWDKVTASVNFHADDNLDCAVSVGCSQLYGQCDENTAAEVCPGDPTPACPCTSISQSIVGTYSFSTEGYPSDLSVSPFGGGFRNPVCGEPPCSPPLPNCDDCPPPFAALQVENSNGFCSGDTPSETPFSAGAEVWNATLVDCP